MKAVFKYRLSKSGTTEVRMPIGAEVLSVKTQFGEVVLYALVENDTNAGTEVRHFESIMTGQNLSESIDKCAYVDTALLDDGAYVIHIFEY